MKTYFSPQTYWCDVQSAEIMQMASTSPTPPSDIVIIGGYRNLGQEDAL